MSFTYLPLSEEDAEKERYSLLEDGTYSFRVNTAVPKISRPKDGKPGNPMIELNITVWDEKGKERYIYDYLVGTRSQAWKLRHFCDSTGLTKAYDDGKFEPWMAEGKSGFAIITQQKGQPRQGGGNYPDKNSVKDYVVTENGAHKFNPENPVEHWRSAEDVFGGKDDVPF